GLSLGTVEATQRYALTCRGGDRYNARIEYRARYAYVYTTPLPPTWQKVAPGNKVRLEFQPGSGPAYQGIEPSHCTWQDRGMWQNEPHTICMEDVEVDYGDNGIQTDILGRSFWVATPGPKEPVRSVFNLAGLPDKVDAYYTFMVYNDGKGCLRF